MKRSIPKKPSEVTDDDNNIRMDKDGRIYVRGGQTLEEYLNHPDSMKERIRLRKERMLPCEDVGMVIITTKLFLELNASKYLSNCA